MNTSLPSAATKANFQDVATATAAARQLIYNPAESE